MTAIPALQRTCTLVKPDGVGKKRVGAVIDRFEQAGLQLIGLKMLRLSRTDAEKFYAEHHGKPFFDPLIDFMTSAPIVAAVWQGPEAIQKVRTLMGSTKSTEAAPGTLRREYGVDNRRNLVHGSDSPAAAEREIAFFFKPHELYTYQENDWRTDDLKGNDHGEPKKTSHRISTR
jgi:nucleoside-diphosphate kinase